MRQLPAVNRLLAGTFLSIVLLVATEAFGEDGKTHFTLGRLGSVANLESWAVGDQQNTSHGLNAFNQVPFVYNGIIDPTPTSNVLFIKTSEFACSGILIQGNYVLTAAHCACKSIVGVYAVGPQSKMTSLHLASEAAPMCGCKGDTYPTSLPDVAIMKLKDTDGLAAPAQIASSSAIDAARKDLFVYGYGETTAQNMFSIGTRRYGGPLTVATSRCDNSVGTETDHEHYGCNKGIEMVAKSSRFDQCEGDSGGPLFDGPGANSKMLALAVRQVDDHSGQSSTCGSGGIYVRLDGEIGQWIQKITTGKPIGPLRSCQAAD